jgi:diguanylate cyclase
LDDVSVRSLIERKNNEIYDSWLELQYRSALGLVCFAFLFEVAWGYILSYMGVLHSSAELYALKYVLAPTGANSLLLVLCRLAACARRLGRRLKIYLVSLLYILVCFVLYAAHRAFPSIYLVFCIPVLLTVVYGSHILTTVAAALGLMLRLAADFFIPWDPDAATVGSSKLLLADLYVSVLITLGFYAACMIVIYYEKKKNEAGMQSELERHFLRLKLRTDELTGIGNRFALEGALERLTEEKSAGAVFVMMDLDNFKLINDGFGHVKGDEFLRDCGQVLRRSCGTAAPYRYGGDEFSLILASGTVAEAMATCRKIQAELGKIAEASYPGLHLGASFGIADYREGMTGAQLLRKADSALYHAKKLKNDIRVGSGED